MIIRRDFVNRLLEDRKDNLRVVSGIGTSTWDLMSTGDEKNNFGFIGAMGQALPFALGLSISQPDKKILLITGDGDTLMSLGSLATIANHPVSNLTVIVLDNESYVETGSQPTATAGKTNLEQIAKGSGIENTYTIYERTDDYKDEVGETVNAAANFAFNTRKSAAVLLSQKMIGAKQFKNG